MIGFSLESKNTPTIKYRKYVNTICSSVTRSAKKSYIFMCLNPKWAPEAILYTCYKPRLGWRSESSANFGYFGFGLYLQRPLRD